MDRRVGKAALMHRFYLPPQQWQDDLVTFPPATTRQLARVLRLVPGDMVLVFDGSGQEWEAQLISLTAETATAMLKHRLTPETESPLEIILYQALLKGERHELVWQKGTELGVTRFVPLLTARTVVRRKTHWQGKMTRWQRIIQEAAEQSGRVRLPAIEPPRPFARVWPLPVGEAVVSLFPALSGNPRWSWPVLVETLPSPRQLHLFIGPEGDFTAEEVAIAEGNGCFVISLGKRVLRSETAALTLVTIAQHRWGDLTP